MKFKNSLFLTSIIVSFFIISGSISIISGALTEVSNKIESIHPEDYCTRCGGDIILDDSIELFTDTLSTQKNKECTWRIITPEHDHEILLNFEYFEKTQSDNCTDNYIEVRDGLSSKAPLIKRICHNLPPRIYSTTGQFFIKFVNNGFNVDMKFSAHLEKVINVCHHNESLCEHYCTSTWHGHQCSCDEGFSLSLDGKHCKNNFQGNGIIDSRNCINIDDTENYHCLWKIPAPPNYRIVLNFTDFNLEEQDNDLYNCSINNHVKIINELPNNTLEIVGPYCGSDIPTTQISKGNVIGVEFRTNKNALNSTFIAHYHTIRDECAFDNGGCEHYCRQKITSYECIPYPESYYQDNYDE